MHFLIRLNFDLTYSDVHEKELSLSALNAKYGHKYGNVFPENSRFRSDRFIESTDVNHWFIIRDWNREIMPVHKLLRYLFMSIDSVENSLDGFN